jgi:beta-aspartyl-dipeptidase (metallo-type)
MPIMVLNLKHKGQLAVSKDADMLLNSQDLSIDTVIAKGRYLVQTGQPLVYGTFEKSQQYATGG